MQFGQRDRSTAFIAVGPYLPTTAPLQIWAGEPDMRAPRVWEKGKVGTRSTLDLFGRETH